MDLLSVRIYDDADDDDDDNTNYNDDDDDDDDDGDNGDNDDDAIYDILSFSILDTYTLY